MEVSITTLIFLAGLTGILTLGVGLFGGFIFGTLNRIFFRHQFHRWVTKETDEMQDQFKQGLAEAQAQANQMIAHAHEHTQKIYRVAAEHAVANKIPGVDVELPPKDSMN